MNRLKSTLRQMRKYPSALFGSTIIALLVAMAAFTLLIIPYSEAVRLWRGGEDLWYDHPKNARPIWAGWLCRRP